MNRPCELSSVWPVPLPMQGKPGYLPRLSAYPDFLQEFPEPLIPTLQQFVQSFSHDSHHRHPLHQVRRLVFLQLNYSTSFDIAYQFLQIHPSDRPDPGLPTALYPLLPPGPNSTFNPVLVFMIRWGGIRSPAASRTILRKSGCLPSLTMEMSCLLIGILIVSMPFFP